MKARKFMTIWAAFSLLLAGWTSCVDDTSSLGGGNAPEIIITGMDPEKAVEVNSYTGVNLKDVIKPQVSANISEDRLSYAWYLFSTADAEGNYRDFLISSEKEPDYEINLKTGSYEVVFEVTSQADGYTQVATATLNASTTFSRGFYILKETPDGATELDLYSGGLYMPDLMEQMLGAPLAGKPYNLCTYYNGEYINPDNNETDCANFIYVFTEDKKFRGFRAEDMMNIWSNDNLLYSGALEADEQPCTFFRTMFCHAYVANKGIYSIMSGDGGWMPYSSGRYGYPTVAVGGSKFVQEAEVGMYYVFWSDADHKLYSTDYNVMTSEEVTLKDAMGVPVPDAYPADLECIGSGKNYLAGTPTLFFLCRQPSTDDRYLFLLHGSTSISQIVRLDPSSHLAHATSVSANGLTAAYIYFIDGGRLYVYGLNDGKEQEVNLPGIPAGEEVTFVSNQYLNLAYVSTDYNFDDLIVGTQSGDTYKLYFYESDRVSTGVPVDEPSFTVTGTGKVKSVRFLAPISVDGSYLTMMTNPFPLSD